MRKILIIIGLFSCAYKAPPPGKPDFEAPVITVTGFEDNDTIRDTIKVEIIVQDKSEIVWVKLLINGREYDIDTVKPYVFFIPPPDTVWKIRFSAIDKWDNKALSKIFTLFGPFVDTLMPELKESK